MGGFFSSEQSGDPMAAKEFVDSKIASKKVVMFSKTTCVYSAKAKKAFENHFKDALKPEDYEVVEINQMDNTSAIQDYLEKLTGRRSVPRCFINQKFVGGGDDVVALDRSGKLKELLSE